MVTVDVMPEWPTFQENNWSTPLQNYVLAAGNATPTRNSPALGIYFPEAQGANPDDPAHDDTAAINDTIGLAAGATVHFQPGKTYTITDNLAPIQSGTVVQMTGAKIDASGMAAATALNQRIAFTATGTIGAALPITAAVAKWATTITGISDTTGLAAGDTVIIQNNEAVAPGARDDDNVTITWRKGELVKIRSVDSATQVTVWTPAILDYGTSGLTITKINTVEDVTFIGGEIVCGGVDHGHNGFRISYAKNIRINGTKITGAEDESIALSNVYDAVVSHCHITDGASPLYLGKSTGYGVAVLEGSRFVRVESNYIRNTRHGVAGGGTIPPSFVDVVGNQAEETTATSFECHEPGIHWTFQRNTSVGAGDRGIQFRGQHCLVEDNLIINAHSDGVSIHAYNDVTEQDGIQVKRNRIYQCNAGIGISGANDQAGDPNSMKNQIVIDGNYVDGTTFAGISLTHFTGASIRNNDVRNAGTDAIVCTSIAGDTQSIDLLLDSNHVWAFGVGKGITVTNITGVTINSCRVNGANTSGFLITGCADVVINGSESKAAVNFGISLVNCTGVTITGGAYVDAATAGNGHGIRGTGCNGVTITGTFTRNPGRGIYLTTTDNVLIEMNNLIGNQSSVKASADDAATRKIIINNLGWADQPLVKPAGE